MRIVAPSMRLRYWRDHAGPEVDYVLETDRKYIPIEVKWTERPTLNDAKYLLKFLSDYDCIQPAYLICRCARPMLLQENILALPWQQLTSLFNLS